MPFVRRAGAYSGAAHRGLPRISLGEEVIDIAALMRIASEVQDEFEAFLSSFSCLVKGYGRDSSIKPTTLT